jgi:hypothetical protein
MVTGWMMFARALWVLVHGCMFVGCGEVGVRGWVAGLTGRARVARESRSASLPGVDAGAVTGYGVAADVATCLAHARAGECVFVAILRGTTACFEHPRELQCLRTRVGAHHILRSDLNGGHGERVMRGRIGRMYNLHEEHNAVAVRTRPSIGTADAQIAAAPRPEAIMDDGRAPCTTSQKGNSLASKRDGRPLPLLQR